MTPKNYRSYYYYLFLPIIYACYLIYIRILATKFPREVGTFVSITAVIFIGFIILGFCIRLYLLLKQINLIQTKETTNTYLLKLKTGIKKVFEHLMEVRTVFIAILANSIKNYTAFVLGLIRHFYLNTPSKKITLLVWVFEMLPKIIVLVVFLIDIIYFKQIYYFYKFLALLLLPLIPPFIAAMIQEFYHANINDMVCLLDSKPIEGTEYHEFCFYDENVVPYFIRDLNEFLSSHLDPVFSIPYIKMRIDDIRNKYYFNHINIVICILYLLSWCYVFIKGIKITEENLELQMHFLLNVSNLFFLFPHNNIHFLFLCLPFVFVTLQFTKKKAFFKFINKNFFPIKFLFVAKYMNWFYLSNLGYTINILHYICFCLLSFKIRLLYLQELVTTNTYYAVLFVVFSIGIRCFDSFMCFLFENAHKKNAFFRPKYQVLNSRIFSLRLFKVVCQILSYVMFLPFYTTYTENLLYLWEEKKKLVLKIMLYGR